VTFGEPGNGCGAAASTSLSNYCVQLTAGRSAATTSMAALARRS